ncbi:hypothetical protein LHYA1_G008139, partial [Lachnellula hyalina]
MPLRTDSTANPTPPPPTKPLSSFTRLSKAVRLYEPPSPSSSSSTAPASPTAPTTILFCSWMNASSKHVQYYATWYSTRFPHARIILVSITTAQFMLDSEAKRRSDVSPAVTALLARPQTNERLLVHAVSNGGMKRLYGIAAVYRAATGNALPAKAVVSDSAPGIPQFRRDMYALGMGAKKFSWLVWLPYMLVVLVSTACVYVLVNWLPVWVMRELVWGPTEGLNSTELVDRETVRGFVYSKEDLAIDWRHVEAFAGVAEERGWRVERMLVEDAHHAQLFRGKGGEKDYWGVYREGLG